MKRFYLFIGIIFFSIDRIIKYLAPSINFEGGFIKAKLYKNYSGAFSLPISGWLYNLAGIVLLIFFIILFFRGLIANKYNLDLLAFSFIIFGGASNLFDRLYFGYVIDYINIIDRSFFNLADGLIIAGISIFILTQILQKKQT